MVERRHKLDATDRDILKRLSGDGRMTLVSGQVVLVNGGRVAG